MVKIGEGVNNKFFKYNGFDYPKGGYELRYLEKDSDDEMDIRVGISKLESGEFVIYPEKIKNWRKLDDSSFSSLSELVEYLGDVISFSKGLVVGSLPEAILPLNDTDRFIVEQDGTYKEVDKSEIGDDTIALTFTLKALINKDGNYTYPPYTYGIRYYYWSNIYYDEITAVMANGNVNGIIIPADYKLIGANYSHRSSSKDFDFNVTIYKNRIVKGDTVNADAVILGIINPVGLASKKTVESIVIDNPVAFNADEQVVFVLNSNIIMDADAYVDEITITLIFKK